MNITKLQKIMLIVGIIITALSFMVIQLSQYSHDSSLSNWKEGVSGYISSMREQQKTDKPIALFFYTDWCPSCEKLRKEVLSTPEVQALMNEMLPVKINPERGPLENQLSEEFGVFGYPTFIIIPGIDKKPIVIGRTSNVTPAQFVRQCRQAFSAQTKPS